MSSMAFAERIAFYLLEAERMDPGDRGSTEDETVARLRGWAAAHNARLGR